MSSTKIQIRGQPLSKVLTRNHGMINSVVCGVPIKRHHRVSNVLRTSDPPLGSVPTRTDESQFLRGDGNGRFGRFGGKFVPETLMSPLRDLEDEFNFVLNDHEFQEELTTALRDYVGRETPLYFAGRLTEHYKNISQTTGGGPEIYLKREDLSHSCGGSNRSRSTWGRHGGCLCEVLHAVFMGTADIEKQSSNVLSMKLLGAQVKSVEGTFKDASSEAIRNWVGNLETTYYLSGTVVGPHPSPLMVREFQSVIGKGTRRQAKQLWGGKPDVLVACVGSGSNALGLFHEFGDEDVRLVGVEAAGLGLDSGKHSATLAVGDVGVYHGSMSYLLQDDQGQILKPHSIGVGLEYPGVGPEISFLKESGRAEFYTATDQEAVQACMLLSRLEGIIPALEASHALAFLDKLVPTLRDGAKVVVNCSGRGDKDLDTLNQRGMPSSLC
ncbi:hypothetical protein YC2023_100665 [Brassica napus]